MNKCKMCMGHGWWPFGSLCQLGPMDAGDGMASGAIKCPWCGAGKKKGQRYKDLVKYKEEHKDDK